MNVALQPFRGRATDARELAEALTAAISGDVQFDRLHRALYATDASIYQISPLGVVMPRTIDDIVAIVRACRDRGATIVPRGAGTGLAGGAVGPGVQIDFSRHMKAIHNLDVENRMIEVEPGVVLDELNAALAPHNLYFAPDVATSNRATIGGMIANNSCGAHSIAIGRTVDHVETVTAVLADGRVVNFDRKPAGDATGFAQELASIRDEYYDEIQQRFPKILRSNGGYGLDRLGKPGESADPVSILCGSEGTLAIVVSAKLRLLPLPAHKALAVLQFDDLFASLESVPAILRHNPCAVELVDRMILDAARKSGADHLPAVFAGRHPEAVLLVEFDGESARAVDDRLTELANDATALTRCTCVDRATKGEVQQVIWNVRKRGLGLTMSTPGDHQAYAFVEDSAVDPARLAEYIRRFTNILEEHDLRAGYYAHASVGCIHVRPVLNLKNARDVDRMVSVAGAATDLAVEFGGTITGEHGDGIVRSSWLERLYGPRIVEAFARVKRLFDPDRLLNPGKIVNPWPMSENLRYGSGYRTRTVKTYFRFAEHQSMAGLVEMCSGVGECRKRLTGTMCPPYMATADEKDTTRARANALRVALGNPDLLDGLADDALIPTMDLCIACKACKSECPTGVDMARLKAEYLAQRALVHGYPQTARIVGDIAKWSKRGSRLPALANLAAQSSLIRGMCERKYGLDRRIAPPRFARQSFRDWFRKHRRNGRTRAPRGSIVYFVDTWTNYYTPQVGRAAVTLLEAAGYEVLCPDLPCCGRPLISAGRLAEARGAALTLVRALLPFVHRGLRIVGTEPSCVSALTDDYPDLLDINGARRVAGLTTQLESFIAQLIADEPDGLHFNQPARPLRLHAHCHQKALTGTADIMAILAHVFGDAASEIDSGCCGMAGSFGHEKSHYDVAQAIGEHRLFPAVRARGTADIAVSGFSCRHQIGHHTDATPRHIIEILAELL